MAPLLAAVIAGPAAYAAIVSTSGSMAVFPASTANYTSGPYDDPAQAPIRLWTERVGISLAEDVVLDTALADSTLRYVTGGAGVGETAFSSASGPTLAAGAVADIYYAYLDPAGVQSQMGSVTFDTSVLGIVAYTERLQFSDFLRVSGAPYPSNPAFEARGWENTEWAQLSADRRTLTFFGTASTPGDQFRIFVMPVPEPSTYTTFATAMLALLATAIRRRGRPTTQSSGSNCSRPAVLEEGNRGPWLITQRFP